MGCTTSAPEANDVENPEARPENAQGASAPPEKGGANQMGQQTGALTTQEVLHAMPLTIVIFGATGDLAKKKLFPALYQLCLLGHLPLHVSIVGFGRKAVDLPSFIAKQCANIKEDKRLPKEKFTARIFFHAGAYDQAESYERLDAMITKDHEQKKAGNRIFFLSIPPTIFGAVTQCISEKARAPQGGYTRLMIEKPFGRDTESFEVLNKLMSAHFEETQLFRLDHYLGKEVILNMPTLRWANSMFEPIWNSKYIESVHINWKEDLGTGGRGGYFDTFGIIRDILQNHLLQAFMFLAIEPPAAMTAANILKAKVDLLRAERTLSLDRDAFLAQFGPSADEKGYLEDETVPHGSTCPTFAAVILTVDNERWKNVPFLFTAG